MKNKLTIMSRLGIVAIAVGSVSLVGSMAAQNPRQYPALKPGAGGSGTPAPNPSPSASAAASTSKSSKAKGSKLSAQDKSFMMEAAKGGMMEVEWGKWASEKGQNPDVKKFGSRMVADHSKANNELMALAKEEGVKLPGHKASGKWTSDKDYINMMVKDHEGDRAAFQKEAKQGSDPDLKKFADTTSKMIQKHLALAKQIQGKLK